MIRTVAHLTGDMTMRYLGLLICTLTSVFCFTSVGYAHTQTHNQAQKNALIYSLQFFNDSGQLSKITQDTTINTARSTGRKVRLRYRRT